MSFNERINKKKQGCKQIQILFKFACEPRFVYPFHKYIMDPIKTKCIGNEIS